MRRATPWRRSTMNFEAQGVSCVLLYLSSGTWTRILCWIVVIVTSTRICNDTLLDEWCPRVKSRGWPGRITVASQRVSCVNTEDAWVVSYMQPVRRECRRALRAHAAPIVYVEELVSSHALHWDSR